MTVTNRSRSTQVQLINVAKTKTTPLSIPLELTMKIKHFPEICHSIFLFPTTVSIRERLRDKQQRNNRLLCVQTIMEDFSSDNRSFLLKAKAVKCS